MYICLAGGGCHLSMKYGVLVGIKYIVTAFFILCFTTQHVKAQTDTVELNYIANYYFENLLPYSAIISQHGY